MSQHILSEQTEIVIDTGKVHLEGTFQRPDKPKGIIIFAHGSGSNRFSPRNYMIAESLHYGNMATLLFDLLTPTEQQEDNITCHWRFNINLLGSRLIDVVDWLERFESAQGLPIGLFGASTGAAAALVAAAERPEVVQAVVSRGGRPDLAANALHSVRSPTLLIVGSRDTMVVDLNYEAGHLLKGPHELKIVPGASHLFEEPGTLEEVARLANGWFQNYLSVQAPKEKGENHGPT